MAIHVLVLGEPVNSNTCTCIGWTSQ